MIIILNPNGTINEELMLAHGVNQEAIKAVSEGGLIGLTDRKRLCFTLSWSSVPAPR